MPEVDEQPMVFGAGSGPPLLQIASRFLNRPLLLHPTKAEIVLQVLQGRIGLEGAQVGPISPDASRFVGRRQGQDGAPRMYRLEGGVAILTIAGSLVNRGAWLETNSGLVSYEGITAQLRQAKLDTEAKAVVIDMDTPGGEATGMFSVAAVVAEVAKVKPVIVVVNDMAASAGYGIASAATEIVVSPTSVVGSIGVVLTHLDRSGELQQKGIKPTLIFAGSHKVDGNPFGPLSASVQADLQAEVLTFYEMFIGLVASGRGPKLTEEMARATEARVFIGQEAVTRGLADRIASLDAVISEQQTRAATAPQTKRKTNMSTENTGISLEAHTSAVSAARAEGEAAGRTAGATAERERISAILEHPEAKGRETQALAMALEPGVSAEFAGKMLAKAPKEAAPVAAAAPLTIEQRAANATEIGAGDANAAASKSAAIDAAWDKALKRK